MPATVSGRDNRTSGQANPSRPAGRVPAGFRGALHALSTSAGRVSSLDLRPRATEGAVHPVIVLPRRGGLATAAPTNGSRICGPARSTVPWVAGQPPSGSIRSVGDPLPGAVARGRGGSPAGSRYRQGVPSGYHHVGRSLAVEQAEVGRNPAVPENESATRGPVDETTRSEAARASTRRAGFNGDRERVEPSGPSLFEAGRDGPVEEQ